MCVLLPFVSGKLSCCVCVCVPMGLCFSDCVCVCVFVREVSRRALFPVLNSAGAAMAELIPSVVFIITFCVIIELVLITHLRWRCRAAAHYSRTNRATSAHLTLITTHGTLTLITTLGTLSVPALINTRSLVHMHEHSHIRIHVHTHLFSLRCFFHYGGPQSTLMGREPPAFQRQ